MNENTSSKLTLLLVLVGVLLVAVIAQSFALLGFHKKLNSPFCNSGGAVSKESIVNHKQNEDAEPLPVLPPDPLMTEPFDWGLGDEDWDPFKEMQAMHDRIDRMFGNAFDRFGASADFSDMVKEYSFSPDINIEDRGGHYIVTVDLPRIENSDVDVKIEDQTLKISGSMQVENRKDDGKMLRRERRSGSFSRSITLPEPVHADQLKVENKKGVLYVEIPKNVEDETAGSHSKK